VIGGPERVGDRRAAVHVHGRLGLVADLGDQDLALERLAAVEHGEEEQRGAVFVAGAPDGDLGEMRRVHGAS
jgi:hypothetical protein